MKKNSGTNISFASYIYAALAHIFWPLLIAGIATTILSLMNIDISKLVNNEQFYQAAVTFTTGALISVFLAVFASPAKHIERLRELSGTTTIYFVAILDLVIIVLSGLGLNNSISLLSMSILFIVAALMIDAVYMIMRLVYISFKD